MDVVGQVRKHSTVDLNQVAPALIAGIMAGVLLGLGARLAMRIVAIVAGVPADFTVGGTILIVILGSFFGAILGLIYVVVRRLLPGPPAAKGFIYGLIIALLLVLPPFLGQPEGELALISPAIGFALFGSLPLFYGLTLGLLVEKLEARVVEKPQHRVRITWVGLYGLSLALLIISLNTLMSPALAFPQAFSQLYFKLGMAPTEAHDLHFLLLIGIFTIFALLNLYILAQSDKSAMAGFTAIAILLFGAAFFNNGTTFTQTMRSFAPARLFPGIIQSVGFICLILLLFLFPDGRFQLRWTRPLIIFWLLFALNWFFNPLGDDLLDVRGWPEAFLFVLVIVALTSGVIAQIARYRLAPSEQKKQIKWVVVGLILTTVTFSLLWAAMIVEPTLKGRVGPRLLYQAPFAFGPYLLLWLIIPLSLVVGIWRHGLWSQEFN